MLVDAGPEFRDDLATVLGWPAWGDIDRSPPRDPWAVVRLMVTNDHGQALHMRLRDEAGFASSAIAESTQPAQRTGVTRLANSKIQLQRRLAPRADLYSKRFEMRS